MKSQDIVVLLKLAALQDEQQQVVAGDQGSPQGEDPYSVRNLEASLGISKTEINASINRSLSSGLAAKDRVIGRVAPNRQNLLNFILHGLKFAFPAIPGSMQRGVPTGFAAPILANVLVSSGDYIFVWPSARGKEIGQSIKPLFKSVPDAVQKDQKLYLYLALADAVRLGNQRERGVAGEQLALSLLKK